MRRIRAGSPGRVAVIIAVTVAVVATGLVIVPGTARADEFPSTCLDAETIQSGTYTGTLEHEDRDVVLLNPDENRVVSFDVTYSNGGADSTMMVFALNQFAMRSDRGGNTGYFGVDESKNPKFFYNHFEDASFTLNGGTEFIYRKDDIGDQLIARHVVQAYHLEPGNYRFEVEAHTDEKVCVVMIPADAAGSGSYLFTYANESFDEANEEGTPSKISLMRRAIQARSDRIDELERQVSELQNQTSNTTVVRTVVQTREVVRTVVIQNDNSTPTSTGSGLGVSGIGVGVVVLVLGIILGSRIG